MLKILFNADSNVSITGVTFKFCLTMLSPTVTDYILHCLPVLVRTIVKDIDQNGGPLGAGTRARVKIYKAGFLYRQAVQEGLVTEDDTKCIMHLGFQTIESVLIDYYIPTNTTPGRDYH